MPGPTAPLGSTVLEVVDVLDVLVDVVVGPGSMGAQATANPSRLATPIVTTMIPWPSRRF
jgi:hypothetical protein